MFRNRFQESRLGRIWKKRTMWKTKLPPPIIFKTIQFRSKRFMLNKNNFDRIFFSKRKKKYLNLVTNFLIA